MVKNLLLFLIVGSFEKRCKGICFFILRSFFGFKMKFSQLVCMKFLIYRNLNMNVLISGSTGLVGKKLTTAFTAAGHSVTALGRPDFSDIRGLLIPKVESSDVVIHLAGAPIVARWSEQYKKEIIASRTGTTAALVDAILAARVKPSMFISTSAVGIYPDGQTFTEKDRQYDPGFLGKVCQAWEYEAFKAAEVINVAVFRLGIVLSKDGGALPKILLPFRLGLGGKIASGKQGFSWIHINDLINAYRFVVEKKLSGVFNLTSPGITDNAGFTASLSRVLRRPALLPVPAFVLGIIYGEGATALTSGQKVLPERLLEAGFEFRYPQLGEALKELAG